MMKAATLCVEEVRHRQAEEGREHKLVGRASQYMYLGGDRGQIGARAWLGLGLGLGLG